MTDNRTPRYVTDEASLLDEIKGLLAEIRTVLAATLAPATPRPTPVCPTCGRKGRGYEAIGDDAIRAAEGKRRAQ